MITMTNKNNERYSTELKATAIKKMMPPENRGIRQLSQTLGIPEATLCSWRKKARIQGNTTPGTKKNVEKWSSEDKFLIVMESFSMNQVELAEYCRKKGLAYLKNKLRLGRKRAYLRMNRKKIERENLQLN